MNINVTKTSDYELSRLSVKDLVALLRKTDKERVDLMMNQKKMMEDINQRMQLHLVEIRSMKDVNQKLQDENDELRDLCCFLDDDRQKGRKLAREWQRFGRYTSSVMKSEVAIYQEKLDNLEDQQAALIKENMELKELCLFIDEENRDRGIFNSRDRDQGDGSSNSSTDEKLEQPKTDNDHDADNHVVLNQQAMKYIKELEDRISFLERDNTSQFDAARHLKAVENKQSKKPYKPLVVDNAMKILEVQELVNQPSSSSTKNSEADDLDDKERALVRQMCNVVWKKLGYTVPGQK